MFKTILLAAASLFLTCASANASTLLREGQWEAGPEEQYIANIDFTGPTAGRQQTFILTYEGGVLYNNAFLFNYVTPWDWWLSHGYNDSQVIQVSCLVPLDGSCSETDVVPASDRSTDQHRVTVVSRPGWAAFTIRMPRNWDLGCPRPDMPLYCAARFNPGYGELPLILDVQGAGSYRFVALDPTAVPEPATWAMLIAGFAVVGSAVRARRRHVIAA